MVFKSVALALVLVALVLPTLAAAQNLVINGGFTSDLSAWTLETSSSIEDSWSVLDAQALSSSGSMAVTSSDPTNNPSFSLTAARQCVPITASVSYLLGVDILVPAGQSRSGEAIGGVSFYTSADCGSGQLGGTSLTSTTTGVWEPLSTHVTAPAGARSAYVYLDILKNEGGGTLQSLFDDVVFSAASSSRGCTPDATHLCLLSDRFRVSVDWTDYNTGITA
ncbi:MAG TPA: hypothetical protein VKA53_11270, partial [Thermoanaerobaculia bacterium]|nr:hypothetical protein [Thermoanaerobaculia bacterium]